jgi:arsenate reductase-like glutaredoxin family protein
MLKKSKFINLKQTKLSKKHIVNTLSSYEQEIKSFINSNKVKLKNPSDIIKLFSFLEDI